MDDAQNWREHVQNGEYWKIGFTGLLPEQELFLLYKSLQKIVPKRQFGDGLETFIDYIVPFDAENVNEYDAAQLLESLQRHIDTINNVTFQHYCKPFEKPVLCAIDTLKNYGINYDGLDGTFIFWSERRQKWIQIDAHLRRKIFNKGQRELGYRFHYEKNDIFDDENSHLPEYIEEGDTRDRILKEFEWRRKYPWRGGSNSIGLHNKRRHIEPFTTFWHAFNILRIYDDFKITFDSLVGSGRYKQISRTHLAMDLLSIADAGRRIGESFDALRKKQAEYETIAYRAEKWSRSKASGKKSSKKKTKRIELFLLEIEKLGDLFPRMSEESIVDQAFENVIKNYPDLWKQGKGQKEAYLSHYIRSEEPYKSRYYAVFGETA